MTARLTVITSTNPDRLTKRWALLDGVPTKDAAGQMTEGHAEPKDIATPLELADLLAFGLAPNQALCFGVPLANKPASIASQTRIDAGKATPASIARTNANFRWPHGSGWLMLDYDPPPGVQSLEREALLSAFYEVAPALRTAPMVWSTSSSSFIRNTETGEQVTGVRGQRLYVLVKDATDITRAGKALFDRLWLAGRGYYLVSRAGSLLERSLVDAAVWQASRLDFAAQPVCVAPLVTDRPAPEMYNNDAQPLDTLAALPPLTREQVATLAEIRANARNEPELTTNQGEAREAWVQTRLASLPANTPTVDRQHLEASYRAAVGTYRLWGDYELTHASGKKVTVGALLDNPERWHNERFADPLDPGKDKRVAWLNLRSGGRPYLYSHAHGGQRFTLMRAVQELKMVGGDIPQLLPEILDRLRCDGEVYERAGGLVRFADGELVPVDRPWLQTHLEEAFQFMGSDRRATNEWAARDCPDRIAHRVLSARGAWHLPKVAGVVTFPVMRGDGQVMTRAGFDADTGLLFIDGTVDRPAPYALDTHALSEALERIWAPFAQFPFDGELSRGVFLCALLSTVCRAALTTSPAFLIRAFAPGTGKTKLSECLMMLVGAPASALPLPESNAEEVEKRLFAKLMTGCAGLVLDNLTGVLDSSAMCAVLTSPEPEGRILGRSEVVRVQNRALFVLNGNNVAAGGDLFRRVLPITLDANTEAPERRRFAFEPGAMIRNRLEAYRADLLSVLMTYQAEGAPIVGQGALGSFDEWERLVRQCVCWLIREKLTPVPMRDPLDVLELSKAEDPHHIQHVAILDAWHGCYGAKPMRTKDLAALFANDGYRPSYTTAERALVDVLSDVCIPPRAQGVFSGPYFGGWLRRHSGRVVNGLRLDSQPYGKTEKAWLVTQAN